MQYRSRAVAPASPSMTSSVRSSASSSVHSDDGASSSSLVYHSEEEQEDLGDPNVKAPKQKAVKVELPVDATATGAQTRESTSRLRRLCKAIVPA
ncbi:hypothetical protein RhiXN_11422 [Rhizoctonia solani]|uniref:Uncharacterized protein n=1 Tax=Rhizoctonia solani TaxID=456999 RepID=A0A8H8P4V2_9AGAM|nr:uncharacterized protein RhiXN_11422 [Rhizoctonia solani]QRW24510.1 hypothetical protein RhiXN_11422 [Rhizoctonia solani]